MKRLEIEGGKVGGKERENKRERMRERDLQTVTITLILFSIRSIPPPQLLSIRGGLAFFSWAFSAGQWHQKVAGRVVGCLSFLGLNYISQDDKVAMAMLHIKPFVQPDSIHLFKTGFESLYVLTQNIP